jgi:hypothetical protein
MHEHLIVLKKFQLTYEYNDNKDMRIKFHQLIQQNLLMQPNSIDL